MDLLLEQALYHCLINEGLEIEKAKFDDKKVGFYIDIDPDDPYSGEISYNDKEYPISKVVKAGQVEYIIGSLRQGQSFKGDKNVAFQKVKQAILTGKINSASHDPNAAVMPRDEIKTVTIQTIHGEKEYGYVPLDQVDSFVTYLYQTYGAHYKEFLKDYATDRANAKNGENQYIPLPMIAKQNVQSHALGSKEGKMNYKSF